MGSNTSKPNNEAAVTKQKKDFDVDNLDPRSPTPEISRTPLQGKPGSKHNITKNADLTKTFENTNNDDKLIHNNPILSAVIKNHLQSYDPRSPTQEFERTPIVITSKIDELTNDNKASQISADGYGTPCLPNVYADDNYDSCTEVNEGPEKGVPKNLCNGFFDMSLNDSIKDTEEPLGSSTASYEAIENNMSNGTFNKISQILETNFDYVENEDSVEKTEAESSEEADQKMKQIPLFKILNEDPRSPSTDIERTPIVVAKTTVNANQVNVEDLSDDTLIEVLQNTNADPRHTVAKTNKPEELLIYEDNTVTLSDTPRKSKSDISNGSRTPLSCMKNKPDAGHARSKSANPLNDSKGTLQPKGAKRISHIPRLKSLSKQTKCLTTGSSVSLKGISKPSAVSGDCENTPPHSHRDKWDKNNSLIL